MRAPRRGSRIALFVALGLFALGLLGLLLAPPIIARVVENSLADMEGGYRGTLDGVDLRPLSAEVAILGLKIEKKNGAVPVPFIKADELVVGTIRDGLRLRSTLRLVRGRVSMVDAKTKDAQQWGPKFDLADLREQLPFELARVTLEDTQVHFRNFQAKPEIDVYLSAANVVWDGLADCLPPGSQACASTIEGRASLMKSGGIELRGTFDRREFAHTDLRLSLRKLRAKALNPLLTEYVKVDVQDGEIAFDARYESKPQSHVFRVVPRLDGVKVLGGDGKDTRFARELALAAAAGWFQKNQGEKAIVIESKAGKVDYDVVDVPRKSADSKGS